MLDKRVHGLHYQADSTLGALHSQNYYHTILISLVTAVENQYLPEQLLTRCTVRYFD